LSRLGKRIRALRAKRKLTQEQAAEGAKLDEKHWQDIEGARTNPTVASLVGIARALKVSLSELFEPGDEPQTQAVLPKTSSRAKSPARRVSRST
jgi:transcriptional regulator with XRE-family HTH domain